MGVLIPVSYTHLNDEKCHYRNLMELWNERQPSKMKYSTPDALFASVASQRDKLKTIDKILDPTDVSYNTANHGRRGVWWNREKSDRLIVQSEICLLYTSRCV